VTPHNIWFVTPQVKTEADARIFFFPYAGGGPAVFSKWCAKLPATVEAHIAHYPGRGSRHNETPIKSLLTMVDELSQAIQPFLDKPYAFFGHSLGGMVAFELTRVLRQKGLPQPVILFISACGAPHIPDPHPMIHALPESEFIHSLKELDGIPQKVLQNDEMLKLFIPILRADFETLETYKYTPDKPLDYPIIAFGGLADKCISRERLEGWDALTNVRFESRYFMGDHFFINTARESIIREIASGMSLHHNDE